MKQKKVSVLSLYCIRCTFSTKKLYKYFTRISNHWISILFQRCFVIYITLYSHSWWIWQNSLDTTRTESVYPLIVTTYIIIFRYERILWLHHILPFFFLHRVFVFLFLFTFSWSKTYHYQRCLFSYLYIVSLFLTITSPTCTK